jgi:hypothetical protein
MFKSHLTGETRVAEILYCLFELQHFAQIWKKEKVVTLCKRRLSCIIYDQQQMAVQIKFTFEPKKKKLEGGSN